MKVIAISNNKGGVGKTTTALNLGAALAELGQRVLLVDLDAQCNLTYALGAPTDSADNVGAFLLTARGKVHNWPIYAVADSTQLHLLPAHEQLGEDILKLGKKAGSEQELRLRLPVFASRYDYVVLDCPPNLTDGLTFNAFVAADYYLIPTDAEPLSVLGLVKMRELGDAVARQYGTSLAFAGFVFTRHNPNLRGQLRQAMVQQVREAYGEDSVLGSVRQDVALSEAQANQQTIFAYAPKSRGAADYLQLAQLIHNQSKKAHG